MGKMISASQEKIINHSVELEQQLAWVRVEAESENQQCLR